MQFEIDPGSIRTEHRGSRARRVQCVHCKGINEDVSFSPVRCAHCGLLLLVRDHYSRRIGAFQGVNVDAEAPGTAPAPEELFP
jgi:DNA-directed RNA polymerase subunit RPC12/RpoP